MRYTAALAGFVLLTLSHPQFARAGSPGMVAAPCPTDRDFGGLCTYAAQDAAIAKRPRVVLFGDSVTANWSGSDPALFTMGILDRGIAGQTTPQMLVRFYQDVIALRPQAVQIMGGTNDIAGNSGPTSPQAFKNNIMAMVDIATAHRIRVLLASIPPADRFPWNPSVKPAPRILELNAWLRDYAYRRKIPYVDYYTVLADAAGGMRAEFSGDGVHPNAAGYARMKPILLDALAGVLGPVF